MTDIRNKKILNAILFFANKTKTKSIERLKLMKLLWLADRLHLNQYGRLILKDSYNALPHGPIPSDAMTYSKNTVPGFYSVSDRSIKADSDADCRYFSNSDLEIMNQIWENFGGLSAWNLRNISHNFPEWKRFEKDLENRYLPNSYPMVMEDFFEAPSYRSFNDIVNGDTVEEARSYYNAYNAIQSNLDEQCH